MHSEVTLLLYNCLILGVWLGAIACVAGTFLVWSQVGAMNGEFRNLVLGNSASPGKLSLFEFSVKSGVHVRMARWYLDRKAKQFRAFRDWDDLGEEYYYFGSSKSEFLARLAGSAEEKNIDRAESIDCSGYC